MLYLLFAVSGGVGLGGGPGGNLLTLVPVAKWFVRKRGRAMSIATTGMAIGTVLIIPAAQWIIQNTGWREAWAILGVLAAAITVPLSILFLRGAPSDLGLQPDGLNGTRTAPSPGSAQGSGRAVEDRLDSQGGAAAPCVLAHTARVGRGRFRTCGHVASQSGVLGGDGHVAGACRVRHGDGPVHLHVSPWSYSALLERG